MKNKNTDRGNIDFEPEHGRRKYFVTIQDEFGNTIKMEVNADIFRVFEEERKNDEKRRNEIRRHYDNRGLEEHILFREMIRGFSKSPEETYLDKERIEELLERCTPTQRRRFCLHKVYGYSHEEIARIEGCTKNAVTKSIAAVMKKLEK